MAKKHKWPHLSCILQVLLTSAATAAIMRNFDTDHCCEFYILTAFFCAWYRNSKKLRMKSIEWELKIAASFFPNTLQTLSKQVAPTVKPSVLQAIKENENKKKFPNEHCPFFFGFVLFNTFLLFFPFLGHSEFLENITAELSSPKSDCYQNSFFVSLCTRTHTHTSWTGLCFAVWQAEI